MPSESRYMIRGGTAGRERLRALHNASAPATAALLDGVGVAPGMTCLDAGCGGGDVTLELAARVGPTGRVVGLDLDEEKLAVARAEAERAGVRPRRVPPRRPDRRGARAGVRRRPRPLPAHAPRRSRDRRAPARGGPPPGRHARADGHRLLEHRVLSAAPRPRALRRALRRHEPRPRRRPVRRPAPGGAAGGRRPRRRPGPRCPGCGSRHRRRRGRRQVDAGADDGADRATPPSARASRRPRRCRRPSTSCRPSPSTARRSGSCRARSPPGRGAPRRRRRPLHGLRSGHARPRPRGNCRGPRPHAGRRDRCAGAVVPVRPDARRTGRPHRRRPRQPGPRGRDRHHGRRRRPVLAALRDARRRAHVDGGRDGAAQPATASAPPRRWRSPTARSGPPTEAASARPRPPPGPSPAAPRRRTSPR